MRIDCHVHITPPDIINNWEKIAMSEDYFKLLSESPVNKFATAEDVIEELDNSGFEKAVVFGFAFKDMELCRYVNDYVIESIEKYPDRLIGFMVVDPTSDKMEDEIRRCVSEGLKGVGEIFPYGQDFDITNYESMKPFADICMEYDLPVLIHTNEDVGHYYSGKTDTNAKEACKFAENFKDLKIIFAHWGGGLFFYELMKEINEQNKNVYYDTAATPFLYDKKIYKVAKEIGILDKILFGSDYPLIPIEKYIKDIISSGLNEEDIDKLLGINYRNIFL